MSTKLLIRSLIFAVSLTFLPTVAQAGVNRIVELKGEAKIKLAGAINYQPVFQGVTLVLGDILLPNEGAEVVEAMDGNKLSSYRLELTKAEKVIVESVQNDIKNIDTESVSEEAKALMLVDVYWNEEVKSYFLFAAATPLEKLVQSGNQTPVIHRLLGDIYLRLGRWQEAAEK